MQQDRAALETVRAEQKRARESYCCLSESPEKPEVVSPPAGRECFADVVGLGCAGGLLRPRGLLAFAALAQGMHVGKGVQTGAVIVAQAPVVDDDDGPELAKA